MAIDFKLPELGENIHSGDVVNVLVAEGDTIAANDGVIELETDKAVVEIPCPHAGRIAKLLAKKGDTIKVGQTLLVVEPEEAKAAPPLPPGEGRGEGAAATKQPSKAPPLPPGEGRGKGAVQVDRPSVSPPIQAPSPPAPLPQAGEGSRKLAPAPAPVAATIPAGPATRRVAREMGIDLGQVQGSGRHGRITPEDVQAAAARPAPAPFAAAVAPPVVPPGEPGTDAWGTVRRDRIPRIRRTIAEQMVRSVQTIPHVTNFDDADVTELDRIRQGVPPGYLGENIKLTMLPLVMKAVAAALRRHPAINATFDLEHDQVIYKEYVNLGIAVDTPRGLIVPNIRGADRMTVGQLAQALATVAERARAGQFGVEDLRGGTFTISNMGAVGGTYSTPIINHPEVAVLLVGRSRWMPTVRGQNHDQVVPRLMMPLSLSYDHRLVDGAMAARFMNEVIKSLENPGLLLLA